MEKLFGKLPARLDERSLMFESYSSGLPAPPSSTNHLSAICNNLKINDYRLLFPMDGNDIYSCCTIAGLAHFITLWNGLIGVKKIPSEESVVALYKQLSGGKDTGLNELDVLNYIRRNSFDNESILAYVNIANHKDHTLIKQAISLFGGVYCGMNIQESASDDFDNGKVWTAGKLTGDGHCIIVIDYSATGVTVLTWGGLIQATWGWWDCCIDECHPILPMEAMNKRFNPLFPYETLLADLEAIK